MKLKKQKTVPTVLRYENNGEQLHFPYWCVRFELKNVNLHVFLKLTFYNVCIHSKNIAPCGL